MTSKNEIFRLPVLRNLSNARSLTQREALLLRDRGFGRATRRWIVWRDDAGTVTLGRPAGNGWEMHRVYR
jgi:hypothetical protein